MIKKTLLKSSNKIKNEILTQEHLKQELYYNSSSGRFRRVFVDMPPENGQLVPNNNHGRSRISVFGKVYEASRLAVLWMEGRLPEKPLEHRNGILYDNRWKNLTTGNPRNKSGVDGVYWSKRYNGWRCHIITRSGSKRILGTFGDMEEAIRIMREAQKMYDKRGKLHWKDLAEIVLKKNEQK